MAKCILCTSAEDDELLYGEFLHHKKMSAHTYCLYLTSNLPQLASDDVGFLGFRFCDIEKEVRRIRYLKCCYCRKNTANIGCCLSRCRHTFHTGCGLKHGAQYQFVGSFPSFCRKHAEKVNARPASDELCSICYDKLTTFGGEKCIYYNIMRSPCCQSGWFHKICLTKLAKTAGYFFKCPLCNDTKIFRQKLRRQGIFIPDKDAAWELEPNAYDELLERPNTCSATVCSSSTRDATSGPNPLLFCYTCGSVATHLKCLPAGSRNFHCTPCKNVLGFTSVNETREGSINNVPEDDENVYVDVFNIDNESVDNITAKNRCESVDNELEKQDEDVKPGRSQIRLRIVSSSSKENGDESDEDIVKPYKSQKKLRILDDSNEKEENDDIILGEKHCESDEQHSDLVIPGRSNMKRRVDDSDEEELDLRNENKAKCNANYDKDQKERLPVTSVSHHSEEKDDSDDDDPLEYIDRYLCKNRDVNGHDQNHTDNKCRQRSTDKFSLHSISSSETRAAKRSPTSDIAEDKPSNSSVDASDVKSCTKVARQNWNCKKRPNSADDSDSERSDDRMNSLSSYASSSTTLSTENRTENQSANSLNISCIANRTRRRSSLRDPGQSLRRIVEETARVAEKISSFEKSTASSSSAMLSQRGTPLLPISPSILAAKRARCRMPSASGDNVVGSTCGNFVGHMTCSFDPYIMPKFVRSNGKLRRVLPQTSVHENYSCSNKFPRSYDFLVESTDKCALNHNHSSHKRL